MTQRLSYINPSVAKALEKYQEAKIKLAGKGQE